MDKIFCDILISGAGIIGATLALRLVQCGFQVIIIDSTNSVLLFNKINKKNFKPDLRVSAINFSSVQLLKKIKVLEKVQPIFYTTFRKLEIWECVSSKVTFDSSLLHLPNMGIILENSRLQNALWESFLEYNQLKFYRPCFLISMYYNGEYWELKLSNQKTINALLLIGADGTNSLVRNKAKIGVTGWKYRQFCMLLSLNYTKNQDGIIWQVFTPFGPRGFIPLYNQWGSLMWYDNINYINKLQNLSKSCLEKKIQKKFGDRLGKINIHNTISFSLLRQHAHTYVKEGLVLIGDAAHTINPLAGQGLNLGLSDVNVLTDVLTSAKRNGDNWSHLDTLKNYQKIRWLNNFSMQTTIDLLYFIFSNNIFLIKHIRKNALALFEKNTLLKKRILKYALGINR